MEQTTEMIRSAPAAAESAQPRDSRIQIVLFSGGSGTANIADQLLRHPQIDLTILINAYDDGHSTGRLRKFIPGMLGPSDVRKNINRLMPISERSQQSLKLVSDYRLRLEISREDALAMLRAILDGDYASLPQNLAGALPRLAVWQLQRMNLFFRTFLTYLHEQEVRGRSFDFTDCALGNLLFAGCYLEQERQFNPTIAAFAEFFEVEPNVLLNITQGENLFLVAAKENGTFLLNEADIVAAQDSSKISELFLIDETAYRTSVEAADREPSDGWGPLLRASHCVPRLNPRAAHALAKADVIIYGPGTQHSSLFPSYLTEGVAEAIEANVNADKVFVGNIHRDFDIQEDDASDLAHKFLDAMSRKGSIIVGWKAVVSHFFVHESDDGTLGQTKYVPFDRARFAFPLDTVKARDWEGQEGRHAGGYLVDELRRIIQSRIDVELAQLQHMVSIVVPALNEEATAERVLKSVTGLDFQPLGLSKEVILVDGGSTDRTADIARLERNVRVFSTVPGAGRGAAMRLGIEKARGNLIVFFPCDDEYLVEDLYEIVKLLISSDFPAIFGTRAVKCTDLSDRLKRIYNNNRALYLVSKYGGMLLSMMTLLLYNRYVTDMLSSVKGYDATLLRSLELKSNGLDLEAEIVAKLSLRREYFLEVPVDYKPRTWLEGKKTRTSHGLRALMALIRYRVKLG